MRASSYGQVDRAVEGITVALGAWNYPVALAAKKIGPPLVSGGVVVLKPALTTPLTTLQVVELLNRGGLPPGVLNCVTGRGDGIGRALIEHGAAARVHVTGSDETGRKVQASAHGGAAQLVLELGGSDPMIVCADADLPQVISAAIVGRFRNTGQACTAVK